MSTFSLTEKTIRRCASIEAFQQGYQFYQEGAVLSLIKRDTVLQAEVKDSDRAQPYTVRCTADTSDTITATCTCPYTSGGWCKHIVAVCLVIVHQPERIEDRPTLNTLLADLSQEQLQTLILQMVEQNPSLIEVIEKQINSLAAHSSETTTSAAARTSPEHIQKIDPKAVRQQVRSILHSLDRMRSSEAYWHIGEIVEEVQNLLDEQVWSLIKADQGRDALMLLEAITKEYIADWENLDDSDGEASGFFSGLGSAWTEAILSADLSGKEGKAWAKKLAAWQQEVDDYGVDEAFEAAQDAALHGWDYPPLQRVLQGHITEQGAWKDEAPYYADELAIARLNVLERRERWQEYLYLAEAEGRTEAYVTMLVRLGRVQEAVEHGQKYLGTPGEALSLAKALYEHGEREEALQIGERGLSLEGAKISLAKWLRDEAAVMGKMEQALAAAKVVFQEELDLANYQRAAQLADEQWPEVRTELLDYARHPKSYAPGRIDVFVHEGLIDDAIAAVEAMGSYYTYVEKVVDAATQSRPEWVVQACRKQAEEIMNAGKAELYHAAARWLARARTAYQTLGREDEWQAYLSELMARHMRKYKLMPMLKALR